MARRAGKMRGDLRAMEEQHTLPQSNPIHGGSATPSMGLSQFRGGGDMSRMVGAGTGGMKGCGKEDGRVFPEEQVKYLGYKKEYEAKGFKMVGGEFPPYSEWSKYPERTKREFLNQWRIEYTGGRRGCGTGGRNNKMEEAHRLGRQLNQHLHSLHGAGYAKAFGGGFFDDFKNAFQKVGNEITNPNSVLRGQILPEAAKYSAYAAPVLDVAGTAVGLPGAGTMLSRGLTVAQSANEGARALGYGRRRGCGTGGGKLVITHGAGRERDDVAMMSGMGYSGCGEDSSDEEMEGGQSFANPSSMSMSGPYQGQGTGGRRKRASAGPNDGRRKRAEIVRKVMAEKGMKMIEASKYVKEHGLY